MEECTKSSQKRQAAFKLVFKDEQSLTGAFLTENSKGIEIQKGNPWECGWERWCGDCRRLSALGALMSLNFTFSAMGYFSMFLQWGQPLMTVVQSVRFKRLQKYFSVSSYFHQQDDITQLQGRLVHVGYLLGILPPGIHSRYCSEG